MIHGFMFVLRAHFKSTIFISKCWGGMGCNCDSIGYEFIEQEATLCEPYGLPLHPLLAGSIGTN